MQSYLRKFQGARSALPPPHSSKAVLLAWLGGFCAIALLAALSNALSTVLMLGSFGASCVLIFGFPDVPFSQPRNVVLGHLMSSVIGLVFLKLCGPSWWALGLAAATAIAAMMLTRTVHPPAGSNPVIVFLSSPGWEFALFPTLAGALVLVAVALLYNNATRPGRYPTYW